MCDILAGLSGYCHDFALICYQPNFLSQPLHWLITILDLVVDATTGWHWPLCGFITRNTFSYTVYISANKVFTDWGGRIVCSSASRLRKGPASVPVRWADTFICNSLSLHQKPRYILMNSREYIEKIMGYMAASPKMGFRIYVGINTHNQKIQGILIVLLIFNFDVFFYSTVWHLNCTGALKVQCCGASSPGQQVGLFSQTVFLWPGAGPKQGAYTSELKNTGFCTASDWEGRVTAAEGCCISWNPVLVPTAKRLNNPALRQFCFCFEILWREPCVFYLPACRRTVDIENLFGCGYNKNTQQQSRGDNPKSLNTVSTKDRLNFTLIATAARVQVEQFHTLPAVVAFPFNTSKWMKTLRGREWRKNNLDPSTGLPADYPPSAATCHPAPRACCLMGENEPWSQKSPRFLSRHLFFYSPILPILLSLRSIKL